jgi:hypothetical protein
MDTVRIGFSLRELYGLSCCACDIRNAFIYGKTKEKVRITASPEFAVNLGAKNLIIIHVKECRHSRILFRSKC